MPVYRLNLIFEALGRGWEESYFRNFESAVFANAFDFAVTLAQKRIALCGTPVFIKAYSMQDPVTDGRQGSVFYFPQPLYAGPGPDQNGAASPDTSIDYTMVYNATNATATKWLRGIWDAAVREFNKIDGAFYAQWLGLFDTFKQYMLDKGVGWYTRTRAKQNLPVSYSIAVDPTVPVFTFPAATFDVLDEGKFKLVRFSKFNGGSSVLNGEQVLQVLSPTTAKASVPIAVGPFLSTGRAIVYGAPVFHAASTMGVTRVGRRAPGAPKLYTPGRSRKRKRT